VELRVIFSPEAAADLFNLYEYIARQSGLARALNYINRIEAHCTGFNFPLNKAQDVTTCAWFARRGIRAASTDCFSRPAGRGGYRSHFVRRTRCETRLWETAAKPPPCVLTTSTNRGVPLPFTAA
jgi:hypothetical protein